MKKIIRGITLSMASLFLLVAVSVFGQENPASIAELKSLARKMDSTRLTKKQMAALSKRLAELTSEEVFQLRQLWREELVRKGEISAEDADSFPLLEKFDWELYQKIEELFGEGKTIYNISQEELDLAEESLRNSGKEEDFLANLGSLAYDNELNKSLKASGCYFDNNWPNWMKAVAKSGNTYRGGGVGRVKNESNEWPCDFVIYVTANKYTKVTGLNGAARDVVNYSGGLSASPSNDAVIVGYRRVLRYGIPTEDWVRNYILFKK